MLSAIESKLCECGCLKFAKPGSRFIKGHNKARLGTGKPKTPSHLCWCNKCGLMTNPGRDYIKGHGKGNQGHKDTLEQLQNRSDVMKKVWEREGFREKHHESMIKAWEGDEIRERHSVIQKEVQNRSEVRARSSQTATNSWNDPQYREKTIQSHIITENLPENRERHSREFTEMWENRPELREQMATIQRERMLQVWANDDSRAQLLAAISKGLHLHPNKPEIVLWNLLQLLYPDHYRYCGDFSFIINGKNPDFVNINGQKKCIELFGDYWHRGHNPQDRKDIFAKDGWDTLVIWEHELQNIERVKFRIHRFHRRESTTHISPTMGPG